MQKDNRDENSVKVNYRFVLWKENTDTADALFHLARAAKCKGSFQIIFQIIFMLNFRKIDHVFTKFLELNYETYKRQSIFPSWNER